MHGVLGADILVVQEGWLPYCGVTKLSSLYVGDGSLSGEFLLCLFALLLLVGGGVHKLWCLASRW